MPGSCGYQMLAEPFARGIRKHRHPVAAALRVADGDVAEVEVDVLDSEPEALEDAHAGAVEQQDHELGGPLEVRQNRRHLVAAEDGRQAARLASTDNFVEPSDLEFYLLGQMEGKVPDEVVGSAGTNDKAGLEGSFGHEM